MTTEPANSANRPEMAPHGLALSLLAIVLALWMGVMAVVVGVARLPPEATGRMVVVFPPALDADERLLRVAGAGGTPVASTVVPGVWVVDGDAAGLSGRLREAGAVVTLSEAPFHPLAWGGCGFAVWSRARGAGIETP